MPCIKEIPQSRTCTILKVGRATTGQVRGRVHTKHNSFHQLMCRLRTQTANNMAACGSLTFTPATIQDFTTVVCRVGIKTAFATRRLDLLSNQGQIWATLAGQVGVVRSGFATFAQGLVTVLPRRSRSPSSGASYTVLSNLRTGGQTRIMINTTLVDARPCREERRRRTHPLPAGWTHLVVTCFRFMTNSEFYLGVSTRWIVARIG